LTAHYPDFETKLTDPLHRIQQVDSEISQLKQTKTCDCPAAKDDGLWLDSAEVKARGSFQISILGDLKLRSWAANSDPAWPPKVVNDYVGMLHPPHLPEDPRWDWERFNEARDREGLADAAKPSAHYQRQRAEQDRRRKGA
jgi:hypothetical protein